MFHTGCTEALLLSTLGQLDKRLMAASGDAASGMR